MSSFNAIEISCQDFHLNFINVSFWTFRLQLQRQTAWSIWMSLIACLRVQWNKTLLLVFLRNIFNLDNVCDIRNCTRSLACHEEINAEILFHSLEVWQELPVGLMS